MKSLNHIHSNPQAGQAVLTAVIFFLAITLTIILGVATPILNQVQLGNDLIHSESSYALAQSGLEDAVYRKVAGYTVSNGDTIQVNGYTTTISVTSTMNGDTFEASSDLAGLYRNMAASVSTGSGVSFSYGVQTGPGGMTLSGSSEVNGSVYSDGPIVGSGSTRITGSAISADSESLTADQSNMSPMPITSCTSSTCITFGNSSATQDVAQSFQVSNSGPLNNIQFYLKRIGSPSNITVRIVADNAGSPGSTDLISGNDGTILASSVSTSGYATTTASFPSYYTLSTGQTYWLILDSSPSSSSYYSIGANTSYANGVAEIGQYPSTWSATSPAGLDIYFNLYLGGAYGTVCGGTYTTSCSSSYDSALTVGSGSTGNAWAHTIMGSTVDGTMYCTLGGGSGSPYYDSQSSCNTSQGDPPAIAFPVSDGNFQDWENEATSTGGWTYSGNLTIGYQGTTTTSLTHVTGNFEIGSGSTGSINGLEVDGNLTIDSGSTLTVGPVLVKGNLIVNGTMIMTGTVYTEGYLSVQGSGGIKLSSSYGADGGIIVTNGTVSIGGSTSISGSSQSTSYVLIATTSNCPTGSTCSGNPAVSIAGSSGAIILYAPYGTINLSGSTNVNAMAANQIVLSGSAIVNYNSGLVNLEFSSGPTGSYSVSNWGEVQ